MKYLLAILLAIAPFTLQASEQKNYHEKDFTQAVALRGLNKITARVSDINLNIGEIKKFGNLEIELEKCWNSPPEEEPENKALLKISEQIPGEKKVQIFHGWMFSSSPAVSSLEHPVYDVTVIECKPPEPIEDAEISG